MSLLGILITSIAAVWVIIGVTLSVIIHNRKRDEEQPNEQDEFYFRCK